MEIVGLKKKVKEKQTNPLQFSQIVSILAIKTLV